MLKVNLRIFFLLLFFCFMHCAQASNLDKAAVQKAYADWCSAIGEAKGHASVVVKFYAPDAILLPTLSPKILTNRYGGLDAYFVKLTSLSNIKCTPEKLITQLDGNIAINSGLYDFSYTEKDGATKTIAARFTFVYKLDHKQWLIIQHHSSMLPAE